MTINQLKPTTIYTVYGNPDIDRSKEQALLYLYQPIIGNDALSLFLNLKGDLTIEGVSSDLMHADLLAAMDRGLQAVLQARERLEGIGLLSVFQKNDPDLGLLVAYRVNDPLEPSAFFQDELMCYLLLERIGQRRFERLVERFRPKGYSLPGFTETTKHFLEVYRFREEGFAANTDMIEQTQDNFPKNQRAARDSDFDLIFMETQLKKMGVMIDQEAQRKLEALHLMYGLDEMDLLEYAGKAVDQQSIDFNYLRQLLRKDRSALLAKKENSNRNQSNSQRKERISLTPAERQIIDEVQRISPMTYLQAIKQQKGGFVAPSETRIIESLVDKHLFPNSVINLLINYILVVKNHSSLNQNYLNAIANDWAQKKITTPEEVMANLRQSDQKLVKKTSADRYSNNRQRQARKEKLPSHIKQPPQEKKLSPEKEAELNRKLAEYLNKEGEE
ncbi:replication initiation and membrane attachment [Enterococcus florum]|uniref:Replication initiation and membrane attachment n=1 Tax=Enterococcus florum TaxID=2480627 RepID=A0A4P5PMS7_9ENTE|nr:DnaD domain protein [Enterococcus florum]GCF94523.1 replication initiation and membrane attachment [Enterococcus florum]